jgi:hypothetical protein
MDACYYSLIRRTADGLIVGWIPDLPGVTATGVAEEEILRQLSRDARELLRTMIGKGMTLPTPSPADTLPLGDRQGLYRRLLLILGSGKATRSP